MNTRPVKRSAAQLVELEARPSALYEMPTLLASPPPPLSVSVVLPFLSAGIC